MMVATPNVECRIPITPPRLWSGRDAATIDQPPVDIPAPPTPAIARPIMSIGLLTAVAHSIEPSSNTAREERNIV